MRVTVVDPPAYTPPYDHSLCSALAARGLDVELATSAFRYGPVPKPAGYERMECFYRTASSHQVAKLMQHPFDMLRLARYVRRRGGVTHFQWLPVPHLDAPLLRAFPGPRILTAHDILPREAGGAVRRQARKLFDHVDAIVVHTGSGRARLVDDLGVSSEKVHVIPHGSFDYLTRIESRDAIEGLPSDDLGDARVVLFFGLLRPYKGLDVLIEAFKNVPEDSMLVIAGMPRMPIEPLRALAKQAGVSDRVRLVARFISDDEIPAYFRRADVVVLPYRQTEQSGVLFTSLAFAKPTIVTDVGGFAEVARAGGARMVPPSDPVALAQAIAELLDDPRARDSLSSTARELAAGHYSWDQVAQATEQLYRSLVGGGG